MSKDRIDFLEDFGKITWVFINKSDSSKSIIESGRTKEDAIIKLKDKDSNFNEEDWIIINLYDKFESLHSKI